MTTPKLSENAYPCLNCGKAITTCAQWRDENCEADPATGHVLDEPQIRALQWRPIFQADQQEAAR
mgnify:FL=1